MNFWPSAPGEQVLVRRFLATGIDSLLAQIAAIPVVWIFFQDLSLIDVMFEIEYELILAKSLTYGSLLLLHTSVFESRFGATIGKRVFGLRVQSTGTPLRLMSAVLRNIGKQIELISPVFSLFFTLKKSRNGKSLGDQLAGTTVVRV